LTACCHPFQLPPGKFLEKHKKYQSLKSVKLNRLLLVTIVIFSGWGIFSLGKLFKSHYPQPSGGGGGIRPIKLPINPTKVRIEESVAISKEPVLATPIVANAPEHARKAISELSGPALLGTLTGIILYAKDEELEELLAILEGMESSTYTDMLYQALGGRSAKSESLSRGLQTKIKETERVLAFEKGIDLSQTQNQPVDVITNLLNRNELDIEESQFLELAISTKLNTQNKILRDDIDVITKALKLANPTSSGKLLATVARHDAATAIRLLETLPIGNSSEVEAWNTGMNFGGELTPDSGTLSAIANWANQPGNNILKKSVVTGSLSLMKKWNPSIAAKLESKFSNIQ